MKMIQSFNIAIQFVFARLFTQLPTRSNRQRGASALEYLVLAAAIIIIIGVLASNEDVQTAVQTTFKNLFDKAENAGQTPAS